MTVIVVEDDVGVRDALLQFIRSTGRDAVGHADAEAFLGAPLPTDQDVVIVDLSLPGISGGKVIEWLLGLRTPPRVVAITGQRQVEFEKQIAALHIPLIRKPLSVAALALLA
jgi:FixJ family two-component response regulator